jgi:hypothetical protein
MTAAKSTLRGSFVPIWRRGARRCSAGVGPRRTSGSRTDTLTSPSCASSSAAGWMKPTRTTGRTWRRRRGWSRTWEATPRGCGWCGPRWDRRLWAWHFRASWRRRSRPRLRRSPGRTPWVRTCASSATTWIIGRKAGTQPATHWPCCSAVRPGSGGIRRRTARASARGQHEELRRQTDLFLEHCLEQFREVAPAAGCRAPVGLAMSR